MFTMERIHKIRELYRTGTKSLAEIAKSENCDWRTVKKYVDLEDFSPQVPKPKAVKSHASKLNAYKPLIDSWLTADRRAPRKQRHTARRVYKRLMKEYPDFQVSYRAVARYVAAKKEELGANAKNKEGYIPLIHHPGEAQADFGVVDFYENGTLHEQAKYLVLSFPHSNAGYLQLCYGENLECLLEGLQTMFEYIGGVPTEIWFDNTKTIVTKNTKGGNRNITERFQRFCEHYGFKPIFCNPASGNEKGNVENKVGYLRRNELVPVPNFSSLKEENKLLLKKCDSDMEREHYEKESTFISELFQEDKAALLPLPSVRFDAALYVTAKADKYGKFTLNGGKHTYSASLAVNSETVQLKVTSDEVVVMDTNMREIVRHRRLYGDTVQESMDWLPYLKYIARKPQSLVKSGLYDMMPPIMQKYMTSCEKSDRGKVLKVLSELTDRTGFDSAVHTVEEAIRCQVIDPDSLKSLYRRIYTDVPPLPPLKPNEDIPKVALISFTNDLALLDGALREGSAVNG